jgi:hypothetical protein
LIQCFLKRAEMKNAFVSVSSSLPKFGHPQKQVHNCKRKVHADPNFAKVRVDKNQAWLNEIYSDEECDRKLFKRRKHTAMAAMVNVPRLPARIFCDHVLPSLQVRLGNPCEFVDVRYHASHLAHGGTKSIDRHLGSSLHLAASVIAVWWASESIGSSETVLLDPTFMRHPEDSAERNKKTTNVSSRLMALEK